MNSRSMLLCAGLLAGLTGCPNGGGAGATGGGTASLDSGTGGGVGTNDGGLITCTEMQFANFSFRSAHPGYVSFAAVITPALGGEAGDVASLEFYDDFGIGSFNLASTIDKNYATCSRCFRVLQDDGTVTFFQKSGMLVLRASDAGALADGNVTGVVTDLALVEAYIDPNSNLSTSVVSGRCLHVASAEIQVTRPSIPTGWRCAAEYYGNGACECGCGIVDIDCADDGIGACEGCNNDGSCVDELIDAGAQPGTAAPDGGVLSRECGFIEPGDNAVCQSLPIFDADAGEIDAGSGDDGGNP